MTDVSDFLDIPRLYFKEPSCIVTDHNQNMFVVGDHNDDDSDDKYCAVTYVICAITCGRILNNETIQKLYHHYCTPHQLPWF